LLAFAIAAAALSWALARMAYGFWSEDIEERGLRSETSDVVDISLRPLPPPAWKKLFAPPDLKLPLEGKALRSRDDDGGGMLDPCCRRLPMRLPGKGTFNTEPNVGVVALWRSSGGGGEEGRPGG
jgi:hypothetical protein